jgi:menaquinone-dependent protoporphyrinogen oxidase
MSILVTYATKHGATRGIAERIAEKLDSAGLQAVVLPTDAVDNVGAYAAVVVGSAVYYFHWMKDALRLLRSNRELLVERPVWLFSSGPLGTEETDPQGRDLRAVPRPESVPPMMRHAVQELDDLQRAIGARDHHVFFGAFQQGKPKGLGERLTMRMPAARAAFPVGDFRDWQEIDVWAEGIAKELA